ncbi:hypothetical protein H4R34_002997 [Dimargaris verticillata]|uniref:Pentatricopeptide repeat-containing protein n=1 Tax=Dimargaris verticillata TaxID=2761393 RepID=A0A9W8E9G2_9FUNG|nr:hypothetical protein H4R34_002997 [Dimargaris verticillata]
MRAPGSFGQLTARPFALPCAWCRPRLCHRPFVLPDQPRLPFRVRWEALAAFANVDRSPNRSLTTARPLASDSLLAAKRLTLRDTATQRSSIPDLRALRQSLQAPVPIINLGHAAAALVQQLAPLPESPHLSTLPRPALQPCNRPRYLRAYTYLLRGLGLLDWPLVWEAYQDIVAVHGLPSLTESTFFSMLRLAIRQCLFSHGYAYTRALTQAWVILQDYGQQCRPLQTVNAHNALIQCLVLSGQVDAARQVYQRMLTCRIAPNLETFRGFLRYPKLSDPRYCITIYRELVHQGFTPTADIYTNILYAAVRRVSLGLGQWVVNDMTRQQVAPTTSVYTARIRLYLKAGRRREAMELLLQYFCSPHFKPTSHWPHRSRTPSRGIRTNLFMHLINDALHRAPLTRLDELLDWIVDYQVELPGYMFDNILKRYTSRHDLPQAVFTYQLSIERGATLTHSTYCALADLFHLYNKFEFGWDLFMDTDLAARHHFTTPESTLAVHHWTEPLQSDSQSAPVPENPTRPDTAMATPAKITVDPPLAISLMRLFVDHAQYRAITVLFQALRDHDTWPEYPLSSAVIVSFLQLGQRTKALHWYRQFLRRGIMVDAHVVDQLGG